MTPAQQRLIARALKVCEQQLAQSDYLGSPDKVRSYLTLKLAGLEHEVFGCLWLNTQHHIIKDEQMFRGTLSATAVYPREVMKAALMANASSVVFYHNHPSGKTDPSAADQMLTNTLKEALRYIDVSAIDHIIVAGGSALSFAERGLM